MRDDSRSAESAARPDHELAPIEDGELRDEELCRQPSVKLCCGSPGCHGLCPVFPSGVHDDGLEADPGD